MTQHTEKLRRMVESMESLELPPGTCADDKFEAGKALTQIRIAFHLSRIADALEHSADVTRLRDENKHLKIQLANAEDALQYQDK